MKSDKYKITQPISKKTETQMTVPHSKGSQAAKIHTVSKAAISGKTGEGCVAMHNQIAERAYEIYKQSGHIQGRSEINWLQAENEGKHCKQ